jgi:hypothetical protein
LLLCFEGEFLVLFVVVEVHDVVSAGDCEAEGGYQIGYSLEGHVQISQTISRIRVRGSLDKIMVTPDIIHLTNLTSRPLTLSLSKLTIPSPSSPSNPYAFRTFLATLNDFTLNVILFIE